MTSFFIDQDDSPNGFGGGSGVGVIWDTSNNFLRLGNSGGCNGSSTNCASLDSSATYAGTFQSRIMDAGGINVWTNFNWVPTLPFNKELPDGGISETPSSYSSQTSSLMSGIVGLWHLDETSGTTARDNSGNAVNGSYAGGYTLGQSGKLKNATLLNGSSGYVLTGNLKGLFTSTDLTLSIWFMASAAGVIVSELGQSTINSSWHDSQIEILNTGQVKISVWKGAVYNFPLGIVSFGQWNHVVLRYTTSSTFLDGFLNGVKITGVVGARDYPNGSFASNYYYALGAKDTTDLGSGAYFKGTVDEFAIWSRPILDSEALELYRRGANRLKYQIRSCAQSGCSDNPSWQGPDGTNQSYFSELNNNIAPSDGGDLSSTDSVLSTLPNMLFSTFSSLGISSHRYFQYRAIFESDDSNNLCNYGTSGPCSAELKSVSVP